MRSEKDINFAIFGTETDPRNDESDIRTLDNVLDRLQGIDERQGKIARKALYNDPKKLEDALKDIKDLKAKGGGDGPNANKILRDNIEASIFKKLQQNLDSAEETTPNFKSENKKRLGEALSTLLRSRNFSSVREDKQNAWDALDDLMGKSTSDSTRMTNQSQFLLDMIGDGPLDAIRNRLDVHDALRDTHRAQAMKVRNDARHLRHNEERVRDNDRNRERLLDYYDREFRRHNSGYMPIETENGIRLIDTKNHGRNNRDIQFSDSPNDMYKNKFNANPNATQKPKEGILNRATNFLQKAREKVPNVSGAIQGVVDKAKDIGAKAGESLGATHGLGTAMNSTVARAAKTIGQAANSNAQSGIQQLKSMPMNMMYGSRMGNMLSMVPKFGQK